MNDDFRQRVFLPVMLPLGLMLAIFVFAFAMSRVMLAVPKTAATMTALLAAAYVLLIAVLIGARPRISSKALGMGLVVGFAAVIGAGAVAGAAGMRELEHGEAVATDGEAAEGEEGDGDAIPGDALVWVAVDIDFSSSPGSIPAGEEVTVALDNQGGIFHNVVMRELGDEEILAADGGQVDVQTVTFDAGTYTYYCDVPGHEEAGMVGEITVE